MTSGDSLLSPESTVTSLLARSGRLRSSLHPEPDRTIKYKNRRYDSATEALEAYIADFQLNRRTSEASGGELQIPKETDTPDLLHSRYRNRDVLRESLTDRELDLLHLPAGPPHRASDRHSVTTDDLLLLPCDGSLPVTRTSAALSRSGGCPPGCGSNSTSRSRSRPGVDVKKSFHSCLGALHPPCKTLNWAPPARREAPLSMDDLLVGSVSSQHGTPLPSIPLATKVAPPASQVCHHLPRWITSHKSEMDFSGVTSIPDLQYPAWLRECHAPTRAGAPSVPSWVSESEWNTFDGQKGPIGHEKGKGCGGREQAVLRELRLQFGETLAAARTVCEEPQTPFRGDRIGFLIQRAEQVLNSPSLGLGASTTELHASPGDTEDLLDGERSWDNPGVTFKSPVPVGGAEEELTPKESQDDMTEKSTGSCSSGYSSRKHPGPVEALKQMLFSLQAVEQRVTQQGDSEASGRPSEQTSEFRQMEDTAPGPPARPERRRTEEAAGEYESAPGGQSLERALHHLGRLKSLVDEMGQKKSSSQMCRGEGPQRRGEGP